MCLQNTIKLFVIRLFGFETLKEGKSLSCVSQFKNSDKNSDKKSDYVNYVAKVIM